MNEKLNEREIVNRAKNDLREIIVNGNGKLLDQHAEKLGKLLGSKRIGGKGATTSQIRNIFDKIKRMKYSEYDISLMRAKLFYVAGRHHELTPLKEVLSQAIDLIKNEEEFNRFKDFFEAIVAYHKYYEGGD